MNGEAIGDEVSVWTYLNVLMRRRYLLLALPAALAAAVMIWSLVSPREYTASGSFIPREPGAPQTSFGQLASQFGLTLPTASASSPQFYADLLKSRDGLREVVTTIYRASRDDPFTGDLIVYLRIREPDRETALAL